MKTSDYILELIKIRGKSIKRRKELKDFKVVIENEKLLPRNLHSELLKLIDEEIHVDEMSIKTSDLYMKALLTGSKKDERIAMKYGAICNYYSEKVAESNREINNKLDSMIGAAYILMMASLTR